MQTKSPKADRKPEPKDVGDWQHISSPLARLLADLAKQVQK